MIDSEMNNLPHALITLTPIRVPSHLTPGISGAHSTSEPPKFSMTSPLIRGRLYGAGMQRVKL